MARRSKKKTQKKALLETPQHLQEKDPTQQGAAGNSGNAVPKSFVFRSGKVAKSVGQLIHDLRRVMEPHTAARLRERKNNKLKDYMAVAGPLSVTHFMMLSQTDQAVNLRIARFPRGPTLTFRLEKYTLMRDMVKLSKQPRSPGMEYNTSPLLVLNNFSGEDRSLQLMTSMFQNMFPSINVATMQLSSVRRVVLMHRESDTEKITFRHYLIQVKSIGVTRAVKRVLRTEIPDLARYDDISDYIMKEAYAQAESDVEDESGTNTIELSAPYPGRLNRPVAIKTNRDGGGAADCKTTTPHQRPTGLQRAVRLVEIGPRMTLSLLKIQDGFCAGEILHHAYIEKSRPELDAMAQAHANKAREKAKRRAEQEAHVARKAAAAAAANGDEVGVEEEEDAMEEEMDDDQEEKDVSSDEDPGDFWDDDVTMA